MPPGKASSLVDTRVIYCRDNLKQLQKLPAACVDLITIDPPFNSNRNYEVFWGETKEKRAFEDRHESTRAYIDTMRASCVELARVLKKTGSFYCHCDCTMQVKQKDKAGRPDMDAFETAMRRAKCAKGFFVSFDFSSDAMREIQRFFVEEHRIIIPVTVQEIPDEQIPHKLG